jgi:hypothetical protein
LKSNQADLDFFFGFYDLASFLGASAFSSVGLASIFTASS